MNNYIWNDESEQKTKQFSIMGDVMSGDDILWQRKSKTEGLWQKKERAGSENTENSNLVAFQADVL